MLGDSYSAETMSATGALWDMIRESGTSAGDAVREVSQVRVDNIRRRFHAVSCFCYIVYDAARLSSSSGLVCVYVCVYLYLCIYVLICVVDQSCQVTLQILIYQINPDCIGRYLNGIRCSSLNDCRILPRRSWCKCLTCYCDGVTCSAH